MQQESFAWKNLTPLRHNHCERSLRKFQFLWLSKINLKPNFPRKTTRRQKSVKNCKIFLKKSRNDYDGLSCCRFFFESLWCAHPKITPKKYFHKVLNSLCRMVWLLYFTDNFRITFWILFWIRNGIVLPKLFWPTVRKNCS